MKRFVGAVLPIVLLVVAPEFWDGPRQWPVGCRPVVFSTELVMRNAGTLQAPAVTACGAEVKARAVGAASSHRRSAGAWSGATPGVSSLPASAGMVCTPITSNTGNATTASPT